MAHLERKYEAKVGGKASSKALLNHRVISLKSDLWLELELELELQLKVQFLYLQLLCFLLQVKHSQVRSLVKASGQVVGAVSLCWLGPWKKSLPVFVGHRSAVCFLGTAPGPVWSTLPCDRLSDR